MPPIEKCTPILVGLNTKCVYLYHLPTTSNHNSVRITSTQLMACTIKDIPFGHNLDQDNLDKFNTRHRQTGLSSRAVWLTSGDNSLKDSMNTYLAPLRLQILHFNQRLSFHNLLISHFSSHAYFPSSRPQSYLVHKLSKVLPAHLPPLLLIHPAPPTIHLRHPMLTLLDIRTIHQTRISYLVSDFEPPACWVHCWHRPDPC